MTKHIVACSTQRSGHNAIIKWMLYQNENVDAFREWTPIELNRTTPTTPGNAASLFRWPWSNNLVSAYSVEYGPYTGVEISAPPDIPAASFTSTQNYSYTNLPSSSLVINNFADKSVSYVLQACDTCDNITDPVIVVILREWKNYIASHIKHAELAKNQPSVKARVRTDIYKEYASYFLNESPYYPILFDAWFADEEYRVKICKDLGLHFTDIGKQSVPSFGGGSSFDFLSFNGRAEKMNVLSRYKQYEDNENYKEFMRDEEAVELNNKILEKHLCKRQ